MPAIFRLSAVRRGFASVLVFSFFFLNPWHDSFFFGNIDVLIFFFIFRLDLNFLFFMLGLVRQLKKCYILDAPKTPCVLFPLTVPLSIPSAVQAALNMNLCGEYWVPAVGGPQVGGQTKLKIGCVSK
jgi:hypothetical protein